ncbi:hypothetical protein LCGC14_1042350 [marine sediment metagenome]|uniref:Uncharacterized protein n=1 Tax=marine sediment metagenome TaxID=412755 RepID=A0A0F9MVT7_9ZZZZ
MPDLIGKVKCPNTTESDIPIIDIAAIDETFKIAPNPLIKFIRRNKEVQ